MNEEKVVRIITRRAGHNYGSSLQAFAIQYVINKLGFKNKIIDYDEYCHNIRWRVRPILDDFFYQVMRIIDPVSKLLFSKKYKWFIDRNIQKMGFDLFEKENMTLTQKKFKTSKEIEEDAKNYDICICGSDQIWNPLLFDPVMFLDFCNNKRTKTIAYAPSFGVSNLDKNKDEIKKLLEGINRISVREEAGAKIVKDLVKNDVPVVLDPTLLVEKKEWEKILKPIKSDEPYILCYFLGKKYIPHKFIENLKKETGYKVINICTYRTMNGIESECITTASPSEFLSYISNAAYVCTDSFHGTIFSIIFQRQFFTFKRFGKEKGNQNSRIYTLLNICKLKCRLIDYAKVTADGIPDLDYEKPMSNLEAKIKLSKKYLELALKN